MQRSDHAQRVRMNLIYKQSESFIENINNFATTSINMTEQFKEGMLNEASINELKTQHRKI